MNLRIVHSRAIKTQSILTPRDGCCQSQYDCEGEQKTHGDKTRTKDKIKRREPCCYCKLSLTVTENIWGRRVFLHLLLSEKPVSPVAVSPEVSIPLDKLQRICLHCACVFTLYPKWTNVKQRIINLYIYQYKISF